MGNYTFPMLNDGTHFIKVFGEDSMGTRYHSTIRYFLIDTITPDINIISPSTDEFFGTTPPNFQISFTELNLDSTWYYLGPGTNEVTFTGLTGTIDQIEWDKLGAGPITIRFYINDTGGLENFEERTIHKDLTSPTSSILYTPYSTPNIVIGSTMFTITADDGTGSGVSQIRYKINNSIWFDYTGPFDLSGYSFGNYLITYQSIDAVGNVESENTELVILVAPPEEPEEPIIPSFNTFILLGIIGLVSAILIRKYKK